LVEDERAAAAAAMDDNEQQQYVKLISAEKAEFWVDRDCVMISGTIKAMLSGSFAESKGEISFAEIRTAILEKVIQYMYYKVRYTNSKVRTPEFNIEPELALELLMAANFLDC
jgi:Skp1 family, tetramerisation domain